MSWNYNPFTGQLDKVGTGGPGSVSPWVTVSDTVVATSTGAVDSIANASFYALKYIITIYNDANTAYRTFEYNVLNNNGSYKDTLNHNLKAGGLSVDVDSVNNAGTFELQITNNESYDVNIELAKLVLA